MTLRDTRALVALLSVGAVVSAACGGDDGASVQADKPLGPGPEQAVEVEPEMVGEEEAPASIEPVTVDIDATVRYAAMIFDLGQAELGPSDSSDEYFGDFGDFDDSLDPAVGRLTIDTQVENLGDSDIWPVDSLYLERDGAALDVGYFDNDFPTVPAGARSNGLIVVDGLPADFTLDGVELVFGDGSVHQARVPLDGDGPVVALEPLDLTPGEVGHVGELTVTITGGHLRYDHPGRHEQLAVDKAHLVIDYEVTASAAMNDYAGAISYTSLQLGLPDGTRIGAPFQAEGRASSTDIQPSATAADLSVYFEVPADLRGAFELVLTGYYGTEEFEDVSGFTPFELTD